MRVPTAANPCQQLKLSGFWILVILLGLYRYICIFFSEVYLQIFCVFLNEIAVFLLLSPKNSLYILDTRP